MANLERSWMESPYHYCARCQRRKHLTEMTWQMGQLVCNEWDLDTMVIGEREIIMMRVLTSGPQEELRPDRKLTEPNAGNSLVDEVILA